jgi:hypothetical protein
MYPRLQALKKRLGDNLSCHKMWPVDDVRCYCCVEGDLM